MPAPTNLWDNTFPPDTQLANQLANDLRLLRVDIQDRMADISGTLASRWNPGADAQPLKWAGLLFFSTDTHQIFQWSGAAWVDVSVTIIPPQPPGIPFVDVDLLLQGANIIPTTILTPVANGFFRMTAYSVITRAATTSSSLPTSQCLFTNEAGVADGGIIVAGTSANTLGASSSGAVNSFYAKAGFPIQYNATLYNSVGGTSMQYSLHVRLEGPF